jgi:hypothetical protein
MNVPQLIKIAAASREATEPTLAWGRMGHYFISHRPILLEDAIQFENELARKIGVTSVWTPQGREWGLSEDILP